MCLWGIRDFYMFMEWKGKLSHRIEEGNGVEMDGSGIN
jgi:hypothetical protein